MIKFLEWGNENMKVITAIGTLLTVQAAVYLMVKWIDVAWVTVGVGRVEKMMFLVGVLIGLYLKIRPKTKVPTIA